jgi:hypothetical protein
MMREAYSSQAFASPVACLGSNKDIRVGVPHDGELHTKDEERRRVGFGGRQQYILSRRDNPIVAWHEVTGKRPSKKNRPVGYGMIGRSSSQRYFSSSWTVSEPARCRHTAPYGTAFSRWRSPWHSRQVTIAPSRDIPQLALARYLGRASSWRR